MRSLPRWESMADSGSPNRAILATEVGLDRLHHRDGPECARPRAQHPPDGRARPFVARDLTSRDAVPEDGRTPGGLSAANPANRLVGFAPGDGRLPPEGRLPIRHLTQF